MLIPLDCSIACSNAVICVCCMCVVVTTFEYGVTDIISDLIFRKDYTICNLYVRY